MDKLNEPSKGGFRKIDEGGKHDKCYSPDHNPPTLMYLESGLYEYTCPECGKVTRIRVPEIRY